MENRNPFFIAKFYPNSDNNTDPEKWYAVRITENGCSIMDLDAYQNLQKALNISSTMLKLLGGEENVQP